MLGNVWCLEAALSILHLRHGCGRTQTPFLHHTFVDHFVQRSLSLKEELLIVGVFHRREDSFEVASALELIFSLSGDELLRMCDGFV